MASPVHHARTCGNVQCGGTADAIAQATTASLSSRIRAVADAAGNHPRFTVRRAGDSIHVQLDGWDVGTVSLDGCGCNTARLELAEVILEPAT